MKKIVCILLALVMIVLPLAACSDSEKENEGGEKNKYKAEDIVLSSENFNYTRAEYSIAFYQYCNEFFYDSEVVDFYNVDSETPLKDQVYYDDVTWFDYFSEMAIDYMKRILVLCEAAKEEGISLSEEDLETVEEAVDQYVRYASDYGYSEEEFFTLRFGADADQDSLREYFKKESLAFMYQDSVLKKYSFTEDELKAYADENWESFLTIDYVSFMFDEDEDSGAKAAADSLAEITDKGQFEAYILDYMENTLQLPAEEITVADCSHKFKYYDEYSEFSKWAFGEDGKAGATYVKSNDVDGQYTVYLLLSAPSLRTENTKDIRFLMVDMNAHETSAKAKSYADDLLLQWENGEATEDSFTELVKKESDDDTAKTNGGLIEGVSFGEELPEGLDLWLYDSETVPGNAKVFKDAGCYYVIYYCGENDMKWKMDAVSWLENDKYAALQDSFAEKYPVQQFDEVLKSLEA